MNHFQNNGVGGDRGASANYAKWAFNDSRTHLDANGVSSIDGNITRRKRVTLPPGGMPKFASLFLIVQNLYAYNQIPWSRFKSNYSEITGAPRTFFEIARWNIAVIADHSKVDHGVIHRIAAFSPWVPADNYLASDVCPFLRGCPTCFMGDFHVALFQFLAIKRCPLHGDLLEDKCQKCGRRRPYAIAGIEKIPFQCTCSKSHWNAISCVEFREQWMAEMECELANYLAWAQMMRTKVALNLSKALHEPESLEPQRYLIASRGNALERATTSAAALGIYVEDLPEFVELVPDQTFSVSECSDYMWTTKVEGVGAAGRPVLWNRMCGPYQDYVNELQNRSTRFIAEVLATASQWIASHHSDCIEKSRGLVPAYRKPFECICPAISALRFMQYRWNNNAIRNTWAEYTQEVESYYRRGMFNISVSEVSSRHFYDLVVPAVVSELICHSFARVMSFAIGTASRRNVDVNKTFEIYDVTTTTEDVPAFSLSACENGAQFFCSVSGSPDWVQALMDMTFVSENHERAVNNAAAVWVRKKKSITATINSMRVRA